MNSENSHILVVEDDPSLSVWICDYLTDHGYDVSIANRGDTAIELIEVDDPDLVVLDIMLPGKDGFEVCKTVRPKFRKPVLMLTACTEETDEVLGLELGADDYLSKPIKPRILLARVKALLRRDNPDSNSGELDFGALHIDSHSKSVFLNHEFIKLSANEFDMLWILANRVGEVVTRQELISDLRGIEYDGLDRSIDIRISRLRKKLGDDSGTPFKIKTIWGKGYLFVADVW